MIVDRRRQLTPSELAVQKSENWLNSYWRPIAAMVYLIICFFDFIVAPSWAGLHAASVGELALAAKDLDPQVGAVLVAAKPQWQPLTLMGSGLFHISFGAILGVAAWTRGVEKVEQLRQQGEYDRHYPNYHSSYPPQGQMNSEVLDEHADKPVKY